MYGCTRRCSRASPPTAATCPRICSTEQAAQPPTQGSTHMQITDILAQTGGLQSMARELGVSETEAATGASALVPAILGGFKKQAQTQPTRLDARPERRRQSLG